MDANQFYFPRYLNEPFRIAVLTLDEFLLLAVPFVFGLLCNFLITAIFFSFASILLWRKCKKRSKGYQFLMAFLYWYLPSVSLLQHSPSSTDREILG